MKVMMIQLPHVYEGTYRPPTIYPLGIGYLVSILKGVHDMIPMDLWLNNDSVDTALNRISGDVPDVFCISVYSTQYPYYKSLVARLKAKFADVPVIAGGPGATFSYEILLTKTGTDVCVIGEGEIVLPALLANLSSPEKVKGVAFLRNERLAVTDPQPQIDNLDTLPFPDRSFFDFEQYVRNSKQRQVYFKGLRTNGIISSRGCPYQCTFCSKTFPGSRRRSIENISAEIGLLKEKYDIEAIEFDDELVLISKKRALDICEMMREHGLPWGCQGRINLVDEEILTEMKRAGCRYVGYGVESHTQHILDRMNKKVKVHRIIPVIRMTQRIGLEPVVQYMYGFPGENDQSIADTQAFFTAIDHPYIGMITTPLPGTTLYEEAKGKGLIGDEEAYLMKLTSGYNYALPLVNMTDFTDQEFVSKRLALEKRIDRSYYRKRPLKYLARMMKLARYRLWMLFNDPSRFFKKVFRKFLPAS